MSEATLTAPTSRRTLPPEVSLALIGALSALVLVVGVAGGARGWDILILGLTLFTAFVGLIPIIVNQSRPFEHRQLLIAMIALSYMVFLVAPIFTQYFVGEPTQSFKDLRNMAPQDLAHAQVVTLMGLLAMLAGFYAPVGPFVASILPTMQRDWSYRATMIVALAMIPMGWSVFAAGQFGLVPKRLGSGILGAVASSIFYGIALLTLASIRFRSRWPVLLLLLIIPPTMAFNFFTGSKRLFLTPLAMVAIAYFTAERRIRITWVAAGIAALVVLYPVAQFYRTVIQEGHTIRGVYFLRDPLATLAAISGFVDLFAPGDYLREGLEATGSRMNALTEATIIVRDTPDRVPYQKGWSISYVFISFIPRVIWPNKPDTTIGQWVTDHYGAGPQIKSNTGPTWIGELFFNFGYIGVGLGMFLLGMYFRVLQEMFLRPYTIPSLLAGVIVIYSVARSPQSGLVRPTNNVIFALIPLFLAHVSVRFFGGTTRGDQTSG